MRVLCIDTSTNVCSVAIVEDKKILYEKSINISLKHSELLMPMIQEAILESKIDKKELDVICVSKGPGSFTGVRIGVTTANTLSQVLKIPVRGVSTLRSIANAVFVTDKIICPVVDAKGKKVYAGIYTKKDKLQELEKEDVYTYDEIISILKKYNKDIILMGENIESLNELLNNNIEKNIFRDDYVNLFRASYLAKCLDFNDDENLYVKPMYLKKSQAELDVKKNV